MGGSNRRRQQRPNASGGTTPPGRPTDIKPAWRETFDSWGGLPIFGSLTAILLLVAVLIYANRPGSSVGGTAYTPTARPQVSGRVIGNPDAPVKILEFADFQCPFCKRFTDEVEPKLFEEFIAKGTVSFQYVSFAFLGEESKKAAEAAECAADQGRFWDYHDLLFLRQGKENSGVFSSSNLKGFGGELKSAFPDFDTGKFDKCVDSGEKRATVDAQTKQARDAGVRSTPSFLVNGLSLSGVQPIEVFREAITAAQTAAQK
jgi:protein-disulfide isomerase